MLYDKLLDELKKNLEQILPPHSISEVYRYAVIPPGKLFRPLLVANLALDLNKKLENNHLSLATAIELHHAYTLVHDDLPCMDDDYYRRGKLSTHKAYGQWQAVLVGDGLLNASYELLGKIKSPNLYLLIKLFAKNLGPRGLIQGQVLDLSLHGKREAKQILETHELKTSRLLQTALMGSYILNTNKSINLKGLVNLSRLGKSLGLVFQLLDDLQEIISEQVNSHEQQINPFLNYPQQVTNALEKHLQITHKIISKYKLHNVDQMINEYYSKNYEKIKNCENEKLKNLIQPIMVFFNQINIS